MKIIIPFRLLVCLLLCALLSTGCSTDKIPDYMVPKAENQFAVNYLNKLFAGDTSYCLSQVQYVNLSDSGRQFISMIGNVLKTQKVISSRIINVQKQVGYIDGHTTNYTLLQYEYKVSDRYLYFNFVLSKDNGNIDIYGFHADAQAESLAKQYEFTFSDKSIGQYLFLIAGILLFLFKIVTLIVAIKTPLHKKALWIIFIILGFCMFSMNWTNAEISVKPIFIDLIGMGVSRAGLIVPWMVSFSIPIGAVVFWIKRNAMKRDDRINAEIEAYYNNESTNKTDTQEG